MTPNWARDWQGGTRWPDSPGAAKWRWSAIWLADTPSRTAQTNLVPSISWHPLAAM